MCIRIHVPAGIADRVAFVAEIAPPVDFVENSATTGFAFRPERSHSQTPPSDSAFAAASSVAAAAASEPNASRPTFSKIVDDPESEGKNEKFFYRDFSSNRKKISYRQLDLCYFCIADSDSQQRLRFQRNHFFQYIRVN